MGCFSKFTLFVLNFLVFCLGIAVIVLAALVINKDNTYGVLLWQGTFSLPIIVLIAGIVILIIGFLGCCGALKENSCMLYTYGTIVLIMLIAEIVLGILILVYTNQAESLIKDGMTEVMDDYGNGDEALMKSIDHAQNGLHCCGVNNYTDWTSFDWGQKNPNSVPDGCCIAMETGCGTNILSSGNLSDKIYMQGCYGAIKDDIQNVTIGLGVACIILAIVQLLSVSCACGLAKTRGEYA